MKSLSNINLSKAIRSLVSPVFALLVLFSSVNAKAADKVTTPAPPVDFKYLGTIDDKPVFQINFSNAEGEKVNLYLKDENGNIIYSDLVKDKNYSRKIQLENIDLGTLKVILSIRSKKENLTQAFIINQNTRTEENIEIAKLK